MSQKTQLGFVCFESMMILVMMQFDVLQLFAVLAALQWMFMRPRGASVFSGGVEPRRRFLYCSLLPSLLLIAGGYLLSANFPSGLPDFVKRSYQQEPTGFLPSQPPAVCRMANNVPPLAYWQVADLGRAPLIQSPWGETFQPSCYKLHWLQIYNPFAVGCANSAKFFNWQFGRASTLIYGHPIDPSRLTSPATYRTLHLVTSARLQLLHLTFLMAFTLFGCILVFLIGSRPFLRFPTWVRLTVRTGALISVLIFICWVEDRNTAFFETASLALPARMIGLLGVTVPLVLILLTAVLILQTDVRSTITEGDE